MVERFDWFRSPDWTAVVNILELTTRAHVVKYVSCFGFGYITLLGLQSRFRGQTTQNLKGWSPKTGLQSLQRVKSPSLLLQQYTMLQNIMIFFTQCEYTNGACF